MKYKVLLNRGAEKSLVAMEAEHRALMIERLRGLKDFPNAQLDTVKIAGEDDTFGLRSGDYRALFRVYERERIVVAKIDRRSRVYR